eukprot:scaffold18813_cov47-Prasinocladus_malaysianus.AAC.1
MYTADGRELTHVGSIVMVCKPDDSPSTQGSVESLSCFKRVLRSQSGVNTLCVHPHSGNIILGGSEKASRENLSLEVGWVEIWCKRRSVWAWDHSATLTG